MFVTSIRSSGLINFDDMWYELAESLGIYFGLLLLPEYIKAISVHADDIQMDNSYHHVLKKYPHAIVKGMHHFQREALCGHTSSKCGRLVD